MRRKFQLTAAIMSIILGACLIIRGLYLLFSIDYLYLSIKVYLLIPYGAAMTVLGARFCAEKFSKGICIALLSIVGFLSLLFFSTLSYSDINSLLFIIFCFTTLGMLITALSIDNDKQTAPPLPKAESTNALIIKEKVALLKSLLDDGIISEEEYKTRLKKELDKL